LGIKILHLKSMSKKFISIISPCYNEEENVEEFYRRVVEVINRLSEYNFEFIFIDNASTDNTVDILKVIAEKDRQVKIIVNNRNFGHIRSPYWGILQTKGDATIYLASDLQDPPEMIPEFISSWESGYKVVLAVKPVSGGNPLMHFFRRTYYRLLDGISDIPLTKDATGFGLYDKNVVDELRKINDPYPYLRGLIDELGYPLSTIDFVQPRRIRGFTKNNFYALYDIAMLGIVSHSMVPIRLASFLGILIGLLSILSAFGIALAKFLWWESFAVGAASIWLVIFAMFGLIMIFIGILGEYVGVIHNHVRDRPIVVEKERVNF
jgi:glycosyltransferase involved in cell wall biosynthesis